MIKVKFENFFLFLIFYQKDDKDSPLFSFSKSLGGTIANGVPICPNGLNTMLYSDGYFS